GPRPLIPALTMRRNYFWFFWLDLHIIYQHHPPPAVKTFAREVFRCVWAVDLRHVYKSKNKKTKKKIKII
ncbi:hypothetical protein ACVGXX_05260, partial [Enterobacter intestinihominis]